MRVSNNSLDTSKVNDLLKKSYKNFIYREYKKEDDVFIAENNFYTLHINNNNKLSYRKINSKTNSIKKINDSIFEYNGERIYTENHSYIDKKMIELLVIDDIELNIEELNINKKELFKKYIENEKKINDLLLQDIYYNEKFSNKINVELPNSKKYIENTIENVIEKKYLFKIKINELQCSYFVENNI